MIPRPANLEEPDFSLPNLTLTTLWDRKTGNHDVPSDEFREKYFRGVFDLSRDDNHDANSCSPTMIYQATIHGCRI